MFVTQGEEKKHKPTTKMTATSKKTTRAVVFNTTEREYNVVFILMPCIQSEQCNTDIVRALCTMRVGKRNRINNSTANTAQWICFVCSSVHPKLNTKQLNRAKTVMLLVVVIHVAVFLFNMLFLF